MNDFESGHDWHVDGHAFGHAPAGTWWPRHDGPGITQRGSLHSGLLGEALAGTAASPEFTIDADYVYWRVKGRGVVRVIVDDYIMDAFNALLFDGHKHNVNSDTWVTI